MAQNLATFYPILANLFKRRNLKDSSLKKEFNPIIDKNKGFI